MGITARGVKQGDTVCLLYGTNVPFILRKVGDALFTIVIEAYIHGLMDGKGMQDLPNDEGIDFHIVICNKHCTQGAAYENG